MKIPKQVFAVADVTSKDLGRYATNCVQVSAKDTDGQAVATDGHLLLKVMWPGAEGPEDTKTTTFKGEQFKSVGTKLGKNDKAEFDFDDLKSDPVKFETPNKGAVLVERGDGIFPKTEQVLVPDDELGEPIRVNARLMGTLLLAIAKACNGKEESAHVDIFLHEKDPQKRPITIKTGAPSEMGISIHALLMPIAPKR